MHVPFVQVLVLLQTPLAQSELPRAVVPAQVAEEGSSPVVTVRQLPKSALMMLQPESASAFTQVVAWAALNVTRPASTASGSPS
jgi:hypothetical protein